MMSRMNHTDRERVRIGVARARVTSVTPKRVEYLDELGQEWFVDLEQCARNWVQYCSDHEQDFERVPGVSAESAARWRARCVGQRSLTWVEFMNARCTRLEFESNQAAYAHLLTPLRKAGWHTFDTN